MPPRSTIGLSAFITTNFTKPLGWAIQVLVDDIRFDSSNLRVSLTDLKTKP
jgi:hypothetical protein